MIKRLIKEPFVHFLLLGFLIFAVYFWVNRNQVDDNQIVIDQEEYSHLKNLWSMQWKKEPGKSDIQALVDRYIRQEIFYREALALNLDHNDEIIKKRLSQKMEAVASDLNTLTQPPTVEQLKKYFNEHPELFKQPPSYAFKQVLFPVGEDDSPQDVNVVLKKLQQGKSIPESDLNRLGVPSEWSVTSVNDLDNAFGGGFAQALDKLPVQQWVGPVTSGFGQHLVFIEQKESTQLPIFEDVKDIVEREYKYRTELETQDRIYKELLAKYKVNITAKDIPSDISSLYTHK
ncbi:MAG: peptidyl-prolyl cis-trans isomerase [Acinetobacter sp.]